MIDILPISGPISKAVPRGNVTLDNWFWHKEEEVNIRSPDAESEPPAGGTGKVKNKALSRMMNPGCCRSGFLGAEPEGDLVQVLD